MIVLAIDTALEACQVALIEDDAPRAVISERMAKGQAERIAPMVREAMTQSGAAFADIDRIVITTGPGSFTGVRVGLSFARALALALNKPCVGVSTLEALAFGGGERGLRGALIETIGASYAALYENGAPVMPPRAVERDEVDAVFADAAQGKTAAIAQGIPDIVALARRGARLDPAHYTPAPLYLRSHGAKLPGGA